MKEMDQFTVVSIDDDGVISFVYDVGEWSDTLSFTPGKKFTGHNPLNGHDMEVGNDW